MCTQAQNTHTHTETLGYVGYTPQQQERTQSHPLAVNIEAGVDMIDMLWCD